MKHRQMKKKSTALTRPGSDEDWWMFPGFTLTGGRTTYHKNKMLFWKFQAISRFFLDPNCGVATYLFFFTNHVVMTNYFAAIPHMLLRGYLFTNVVLMTNYFAAIPHVTPYGPPAAILVIVRRTSLSTLYVVVM